MSTVLVTRLMPFAGQLVRQLEQHGYKVVHEPLLSIEPLYYLRPTATLSSEPVVVLTSRATLGVLESRRDEVADLLDEPCYCVGDQTAEDAKRFGFTNVISANGDGRALAEMIMQEESPKTPILHIGGEDLSPDLDLILEEEGWTVIHWAVYKARELDDFSEHMMEVLKQSTIGAVLFHSVRAAQTFVRLVQRDEMEEPCKKMKALTLSSAIADALKGVPFEAVYAAPYPTEQAMMENILVHFPVAA